MSQFPCKNPNCKSFGKPHPNCRCGPEMAKGGVVKPFCQSSQAHKEGCEYFAEGGEVPSDDLPGEEIVVEENAVPDEDLPGEMESVEDSLDVPDEDLPGAPQDYESGGQQALGVLEGVAQGVLGPLAPILEVGASKLLGHKSGEGGLTAEDIKARRESSPGGFLAGEIAGSVAGAFTPFGVGKLGAKAVAKFAPEALTKAGSVALNSMITSGIIAGGDEISKSFLGIGDPSDTVASKLANVSAATFLGGVGGIAFAKLHDKFAKIEPQLGSRINSWLQGVGAASSKLPIDDALQHSWSSAARGSFKPNAFKSGYKAYEKGINGLIDQHQKKLTGAIGSYTGDFATAHFAPEVAKLLGKPVSYVSKYTTPMLLKILSENPDRTNLASKIYNSLNYATDVNRGLRKIDKGVEAAFIGSASQIAPAFLDANREKLKEYLGEGGITKQIEDAAISIPLNLGVPGFAEGGLVEQSDQEPSILDSDPGISEFLPEHNILLQAAKGRISNYLAMFQPQKDLPRPAFEDAPDQSEEEKNFDRVIDIANNPLGILDEIAEGTLDMDHVEHFRALFPEINDLLQKKVSEKVIKSQLDGTKPPYHVRQSLSLFMGADLTSDLNPAMVQAAQQTFMSKATPQQQQAPKSQKGGAALNKIGNKHLTNSQARASRSQNK